MFTDVLRLLGAVYVLSSIGTVVYVNSLMLSVFWVLVDQCSFYSWYCRLREFSEVPFFFFLFSLGTIVYKSSLMLIIIIMDTSMAHDP